MDKSSEWKTRLKSVRRVLLQVMVLNFILAAAKFGLGYVTNTLSLMADGFHSSLDGASNVIGLVGITAAARPPDKNHPYGHHKVETLTSLIIGALVIVTAGEIVQEAILRLSHPLSPTISLLNIMLVLATIGINIFVVRYEGKSAQKFNSPILEADALQTRSDIYVSTGVLLAMALIHLGYPIIDPIASLSVTGAILFSAWLIFKRAFDVLLDATSLDTAQIESAALAVNGVRSVEKIRSRGSGSQISVDLHIRLNPEISLRESHDITHSVRRAVEDSTGARDVVIHTEPDDNLNET